MATSWAPIRNLEAKPSGSVIIFRERDAECSGREQLSFQDTHDLNTGLPNRRGFEEHLLRAANSARSDNLEHVLVSLSLGDYDVVVDQYGNEAGQELARRFSKLLQSQVRGADAIARLADNRFGILLACCSMESARSLVENLKLAIAGFRFACGKEERAVSPTVGITPINGTSQVHFLLDR